LPFLPASVRIVFAECSDGPPCMHKERFLTPHNR
jgi:hypothetical protein